MTERNTSAWDEEQELEYQIGDMNGIAFEPKPEEKTTPKTDGKDQTTKKE